MFETGTIETKKIVEYYLAYTNSEENFISIVNEKIKEGFQPYGTPYIQSLKFRDDDVQTYHYQAMVKYED